MDFHPSRQKEPQPNLIAIIEMETHYRKVKQTLLNIYCHQGLCSAIFASSIPFAVFKDIKKTKPFLNGRFGIATRFTTFSIFQLFLHIFVLVSQVPFGRGHNLWAGAFFRLS